MHSYLTRSPKQYVRSRWFGALTALLFCVTALAEEPQLLFQQPELDDLKSHFHVPRAARRQAPPSEGFDMLLWQPNPYQVDGQLTPVDWNAGDKTGLYPPNPLQSHQLGFRNVAGSTVAQAYRGAVGAYINSADLPKDTHKYKMMITPQFRAPPNARARPYAQQDRAVVVSLDLQVPTAADGHNQGSNTYVAADLQFIDQTSQSKISYGCTLFFNGRPNSKENIKFDEDSQSIMINGPVVPGSARLTILPQSAERAATPWRGWRTFRFAITEANFRTALTQLKAAYPESKASSNPADYAFSQFHLNAELHFETAPAQLGWSMQNAKITVERAPR